MNTRMMLRLLVLLACLGLAAAAPAAEQRFTGVDRVVAVGDVHGDYHDLVDVLQRAGLLSEQVTWSGGRTHLVLMGDLVDRGSNSRRVLDLAMRLQQEAAGAGGRVHVLLGNHEVMWLTADTEYTSDEDFAAFSGLESGSDRQAARSRFARLPGAAGKSASELDDEFEAAFPAGYFGWRKAVAPTGEYGRWLMQRPAVVVINGTAFVHGGISDAWAGRSAEDMDATIHRDLEELLDAWYGLADAGVVSPDYPLLSAAKGVERAEESGALREQSSQVRGEAKRLTAALHSPLFEPDSPLWYRGDADCQSLLEAPVLERALAGLGAHRLVVGHTPVPGGRVTERMGGKLVMIDTGMTDQQHGRPSALLLANDSALAIYPDSSGQAALARESQRAPGGAPMDARALEDFLANAPVVASEDVGTGVTKPRRMTLERDGVRLRAIFKAESAGAPRGRALEARRLINTSDQWTYDVAAYRLDRMLGLGMVPVTVKRTINGREGALQYWVEGGINELTRRKKGTVADPRCPLDPQYKLMDLFDRLIYNTDRTLENIFYGPDWNLVLIDHTRAFRTHDGVPPGVPDVSLAQVPALAARLRELDRGKLNAELGDLLDRVQISALLERRDEMLAEYAAGGGNLGGPSLSAASVSDSLDGGSSRHDR